MENVDHEKLISVGTISVMVRLPPPPILMFPQVFPKKSAPPLQNKNLICLQSYAQTKNKVPLGALIRDPKH